MKLVRSILHFVVAFALGAGSAYIVLQNRGEEAGTGALWESTVPRFFDDDEEIRRLEKLYGPDHYSWHREEWFIRDFFAGEREGFFVDVGAWHYRDASNTYYLEKEWDWSGIAIDAQDKYREGYEQNRPRTKYFTNYVSDVSDEPKKVFVPEDPAQASGVFTESSSNRKIQGTFDVAQITLNDLLEREGVERIDFMTMDIEMAEPAALRGFDIGKYRPRLVCIEVLPGANEPIETYFDKHGYVLDRLWSWIDHYNSYYVRGDLVPGK